MPNFLTGRPLLSLGCIYCLIQFLLRTFLTLYSWKEASFQALDLLRMLGLGLAYDIVVCLCLLGPLLLLWLCAGPRPQGRWLQRLEKFFLGTFFVTTLFTCVSEFFFWEEYRTRFNFIAVDYLVYTQEVLLNIYQSYPVVPLVVIVLVLGLGLTYAFYRYQYWEALSLGKRLRRFTVAVLVMVLGLIGLRSDFTQYVSANRFNQELAGNGVFQLFHAFFHNELDYDSFYLHRDKQQVMAFLRQKLSQDGARLKEGSGVARSYSYGQAQLQPNFVVIMVESLSAVFTGLDDNVYSWTPLLDKLATKSYQFTRAYATGTRTVRGLEALSLGVPPTPGQSIIRRPDSMGLATIGSVLGERGYQCAFIYGGYGYFDNMNDYFRGNGFRIVDRTDIPKEKIFNDTVWGVADEILFDKALEELDAQAQQGKPFFDLLLTTTNHRPFTFPEGRVEADQKTREGVVRYTDWAIHKFLTEAARKPWFDNTVFLVLADHDASVAGSVGLPVTNFHIPCLIYAPKLIKPGINTRLVSQIDILPTTLGLLGIDHSSKTMGYDVNRLPQGEERAFISTYQELGYLKGNQLVILAPNRRVSMYRIEDMETGASTEVPPDAKLVEEAVNWYQGASDLYKSKQLANK